MSFRFISATVTDRRLGAPTSALKALPGRLQNPSASFVLMRVRVEGTVVLTKKAGSPRHRRYVGALSS